MSSDPGDYPGRTSGTGRRPPGASQGASRGGFRPDDGDDTPPGGTSDEYGSSGGRGAAGDAPFGGYPFGDGQSRGQRGSSGGKTFLGLPVNLVYAMGAAIIGIVILGAVCGRPTATGTVAGQVKSLGADKSVNTLPGAQIVVRGSGQTYTATSTDVPADAEGEAAYNYRLENIPPGQYTMAVTPPAGSGLQPEQDISFEVESGQLFPQSVMLLADGVQKPRALAQNELQPGEAGGYVNERGERVVYQQGNGFDTTDALLLYLLWRNPGGYGYGYPPVIVNNPGGSNYRVADPPTRSSSGQTVTERKATTPGQGSTRPSSAGGATGSAPSYSSGTGGTGGAGSSTGTGSSTGSGSSSGSSTQTKPSTSSGSDTSVAAPRAPSQGSTRPSSSSSSPSRSSAPSRSSGGGRR